MLHDYIVQYPLLSQAVQVAILLFSAAAIFFVKKGKRIGFVIGTTGQIFWFVSVDPFSDFGIFLLAVWFFIMYAGGVIEEYSPPPRYLVRLHFHSVAIRTSFDATIATYQVRKITETIFESGFAVVDTEITRIEKSAQQNLFSPLMDIKKFKAELADLKQRLNRCNESLKLNTFDPELWRQQRIENSRNKDLQFFRKKIHKLIGERYELR